MEISKLGLCLLINLNVACIVRLWAYDQMGQWLFILRMQGANRARESYVDCLRFGDDIVLQEPALIVIALVALVENALVLLVVSVTSLIFPLLIAFLLPPPRSSLYQLCVEVVGVAKVILFVLVISGHAHAHHEVPLLKEHFPLHVGIHSSS